jgi:hypothetical protein
MRTPSDQRSDAGSDLQSVNISGETYRGVPTNESFLDSSRLGLSKFTSPDSLMT